MGTDNGVCMTYFDGDLMTTSIFKAELFLKHQELADLLQQSIVYTSEFEPLELEDISVTGMQLGFFNIQLEDPGTMSPAPPPSILGNPT